MCRNWKKATALALAVLIGCMMPATGMLAAEGDAEVGAEINAPDHENSVDEEKILDNGNPSDEENISDNENLADEENISDSENPADGENISDGENLSGGENFSVDEDDVDETDAEDGNAPEDVTVNRPQEITALTASVTEPNAELIGAKTNGAEPSESTGAPEIVITRDGVNKACPLGGTVEFVDYMNYRGTLFTVSLGQSDGSFSLFYALDTVTDQKAAAKDIGQMDSLNWGQIKDPPGSIEPNSGNDGSYVVYAKAVKKVEGEADQIFYARSCGIVVDTVAPVIKGVEEGKTYPAETKFQVEDANLDVVKINEQAVTPDADGNYQVAANGNSTSCMIRAKDKSGNEKTCSITVTGGESPKPDDPEPPQGDIVVISESKEYELQAGVTYHLAAGKWKVNGDKTVYWGGNDFYVPADGTYQFKK